MCFKSWLLSYQAIENENALNGVNITNWDSQCMIGVLASLISITRPINYIILFTNNNFLDLPNKLFYWSWSAYDLRKVIWPDGFIFEVLLFYQGERELHAKSLASKTYFKLKSSTQTFLLLFSLIIRKLCYLILYDCETVDVINQFRPDF